MDNTLSVQNIGGREPLSEISNMSMGCDGGRLKFKQKTNLQTQGLSRNLFEEEFRSESNLMKEQGILYPPVL